MAERCPGAVGISPAVLQGYRLVERTHADIEPSGNSSDCVNGALYEITEKDLAALDRYEAYPEYYIRKEVMVTDCAGVFHRALVYMMNEKYCGQQTPYAASYRRICSQGAEFWGIPNAFTDETSGPSSLWNGEVPEISVGLEQMLSVLDSDRFPIKAKRLWIGAGVVITLKPQNIRGAFSFYPPPLEVTTFHAQELSWVFFDLRDMFKTWFSDGCSRHDFYRALAETAAAAIENNSDITSQELCRKVIEKAKEIYRRK